MNSVLDRQAYAELLSDIQPRVITTEEENEFFLSVVEKLMELEVDLTPEQEELLKLLVTLIENFEDQHYQLKQATPHEILNELMAERNLKQKDLIGVFKSKGIASEVINGKRSISKAQAKELGHFFNVSPAVFL
ncbi:helix-turn-helix domain-containing protein [Limnofasciculus baicalensis]|uniref:Transcriptional regulator n=1 Tax=Limnofasciculus baicalensis BBK-W-15 TaxID=2699891 RepID=A0AAE3GV55_9CYAN|nr:transcriptional regulator [Limnofasciculus baicalensis]MCP2730368.1 transcriptional regulator [Limnofasciculus baicalensis BBK-W-15]